MQLDFEAAAIAALIGGELENQEQTGPEEQNVATNDNGLSWPFIAFPEGWCSSS